MKRIALLFLAASALACASDNPPPPSVDTTTVNTPGHVQREDVVRVSAVVEKIDHATRQVTLRNHQGAKIEFRAGPEVRNLDQVEKGDQQSRRLHDAWRRGDDVTLWRDMASEMKRTYPGLYQRINVDWSAAGDARYLRTNLQYQQYWPLSKRYTFAFNGEVGIGKGLNGRPYPIFKNFYGGGLGTVRAFDQGSLGRPDMTGAYVGGNRRVNLNSELYLPIPGAGNDRGRRCVSQQVHPPRIALTGLAGQHPHPGR